MVREIGGSGEWRDLDGYGRPIWDHVNNRLFFTDVPAEGTLYSIGVETEPTFHWTGERRIEYRTGAWTQYSIDFRNRIAYGTTGRFVDRSGPDSRLDVILNFDEYVRRLSAN